MVSERKQGTRKKNAAVAQKKQGRIHGYPSRVRLGRGSDGEGYRGVWAGAGSSKTLKNAEKVKWGRTDGRTDIAVC